MKTLGSQINFVREFFVANTANMFQRVILFEEIYDDLLEFLGEKFWGKLAAE